MRRLPNTSVFIVERHTQLRVCHLLFCYTIGTPNEAEPHRKAIRKVLHGHNGRAERAEMTNQERKRASQSTLMTSMPAFQLVDFVSSEGARTSCESKPALLKAKKTYRSPGTERIHTTRWKGVERKQACLSSM